MLSNTHMPVSSDTVVGIVLFVTVQVASNGQPRIDIV